MPETRTRLPGETAFCSLMLLLAAFLLWASYDISGFASWTSAGAFPMAAAATMLVCAVIIVTGTARRPAPSADDASEPTTLTARIAPPVVVWIAVAITVYMLVLEGLGFTPASFLFLALSMRLLGSRRWGLNVLTTIGLLVAIHLVFQIAFAVQLPTGRWWQGVL
jgi:putative tricarboxylic transport membrane protein